LQVSAYIFKKICKSALFARVAFFASIRIPPIGRLKKYKNIFAAIYSVRFEKNKAVNNPVSVRIAPVNICNYNCLFCEIHKDNLLFPNRPLNSIGLDIIKKFESFLATAYKLYFCGGSAEPLLNKEFGKIVEYLKLKYGTIMGVNTNASTLTEHLANTLVNNKFDSILVSYHAGAEDSYKRLMGGSMKTVDDNLACLMKRKKCLRKNKPDVQMNFALHKANADQYPFVFDKAKKLGVSAVVLSKYYGGRNKLQDENVAFDYDIENGNKVLDDIYSCAKITGVRLIPPKPAYWRLEHQVWDPKKFNPLEKCILPWTNLYFNPVLSQKDCFYVGVCTRIELFKVDYNKADFSSQKKFALLWNHPVLSYLRDTVNSENNINPICRFCKNCTKPALRNMNQDFYSAARDKAVEDFFAEFNKKFSCDAIDGIEVLNENPYLDSKYSDILAELSDK
jgi:molybdenum cofactor biosynthesis enzyme MoaA